MNAETMLLIPNSTYVDVAKMPWQPTRFPGIDCKILMENKATGMSTMLMRWAPGARLPHHEHVAIEQTFVLEGSFADHDGVLPRRQLCLAPRRQPARRLDRRGLPGAGVLPEAQHLLRLTCGPRQFPRCRSLC